MMHQKHLLNTLQLSRSEIELILDEAKMFLSASGLKKEGYTFLHDRRVVLAFFEPSTRTRVSFETAIERSGGASVYFQSAGSSVEKGESLEETIATLQAMDFDAIVVRHPLNGVMERIRDSSSISIINGGEGTLSHPTQALLDASTLIEKFGSLEGLSICIVGDVKHSRVARSNVDVFSKLGAKVSYCAPDDFAPGDAPFNDAERIESVEQAMNQCQVINLLRIQRERIEQQVDISVLDYRKQYAVTKELALKYSDVAIVHPGPVNEGVEIDCEVLNMMNCLIHRQVTHGVAVRMSVLKLFLTT
ncbi:MAG: aspartate carbamoyltransferase catalytic subunit [Ignavibacteria bacterium]|nr:aspartate carbamoyltransferase catalytic subunit [Ignavibacteria bacterium]